MANPVSTYAAQLAALNQMAATGGPLDDLTMVLFTNVVGSIPRTWTVDDLTQPDFPGYGSVAGLAFGPAYLAPGNLASIAAPDQLVQATAGQSQQTTATFSGNVTTAGNMEVIVTSAGMTGSPITLAVPVALADAGPELAAKAAAAMRANSVIAARFNIAVSGSTVVLTRKAAAANDATLNVSSADDTSVGVTAEPTSAATRAGSTTGNNVNAQVTGWALLNADQTELLWARKLDSTAVLNAPGQGFLVEPVILYGS